jgi:hypothetical protein
MSRLFVVVLALMLSTPTIAQKLYKHVDETGKIVFTDRPPQAGAKAEKQKPPNVAAPEATRQLRYEAQASEREERADRAAQQQRHRAQQQREMEAERERRAKERESNPYSPDQDPYRPRVRR